MQLTCPRCSSAFEGDPDATGHVVCTHCQARLRLKSRQPAVEPASGPQAAPADPSSAGPPGPVQSSVPEAASGTEKDVTLPPGTRLGGFELKRVLGRGGMATVYKGVQLSLNRPVAIKLLASRFSTNPAFVERFNREAGALASLSHPNIVDIIDKGVEDGKYYYFVMEYVEGITLDQLLHAVELNERHYVHLITEISKALIYVHSRGIIHRDIKPSNILVDKPGNVKVSDFGIAHLTEETDDPEEQAHRNSAVGTMNFMAPEQAMDPGNVDIRADVYSLGVTFYKMFTKQLPVGEWKAPSMLNSSLPKSLDLILARAVQPNPADRYSSVKEFCDDLLGLFVGTQSRASSDVVDVTAALAPGGVGAFSFGSNLSFPPSPSTDAGDSTNSAFRLEGGSSASDSTFGTALPYAGTSVLRGVMGAPPPNAPPEPEQEEVPQGRGKRMIAIAVAGVLLLIIAVVVFLYLNGFF